MTKDEAQFFRNALENNGDEAELHPEYSGRGMMGQTTYAVSFESFPVLLGAVLSHCKENLNSLSEIPDLGDIQQDHLGTGIIIY